MAILFVFTGCNPAPVNDNGEVKISVRADSSKAIAPSQDWDGLNVSNYEINALDKAGEVVYTTTVDEVPAEVAISLPVGRYSFNAAAYNADGTKVATASSDLVAVTSKSISNVSLVLDLTGEGNVEIGYTLDENTVLAGDIKAEIVSLNGSEATSEMTIDEEAQKASAALEAGAYLVEFSVDVKSTTDGVKTTYVKTDIVYVEAGKTSSADWVISYDGNNASINIESNVGEPIAFSVSATEGVEYDSAANKYYIPAEEEVGFTVFAADEEYYDYQWIYNNEVISESSSAVLKCDEVSLGKLVLLVSSKAGTSYGYGLQEWTIEVIPSDDVREGIYITTAEALREFADQVAAGNPGYVNAKVFLEDDIDLDGSNWTPITGFQGIFDAQGYVVDNIVFDAAENDSFVLFADGSDVSNLSYGSVQVVNFESEDESDRRLDDILKLDAETITVKLSGDASITANDAYLKLGSENTNSITIEGTGEETLTLSTTYWSRLNTVNENGKIVLKNLKLTSSQTSGTWNSYDITFMCNVELENVDCLKAVALDNVKLAVFQDVSISESHDYYALWISSSCETVDIDGLVVESAGRGIKIDEQYVGDASKKVVLNIKNSSFDTNKKSAILVKNEKGAVITVENVTIENVAADTVNTVWIDEASKKFASLVQVHGASYIVEGTIELPADATITDLKSNLANGGSVELAGDIQGSAGSGGYNKAGVVVSGGCFDGNGNTITVDDANTTWDCAVYTQGGIIRNITIGGAFRGIFTSGCSSDIVIDNVIIDDVCYTISSDGSNPNYSIVVSNSTLNGWTSYTGGYKSVSFTDCKFGKGTGGYQYAYCRPYSPTSFENCEFEVGYEIDATRTTSTLINCYVGTTLVTDSNKVELLGASAENLVISNN